MIRYLSDIMSVYLYLSDRLIFDFAETLDKQEEERYLSWQY